MGKHSCRVYRQEHLYILLIESHYWPSTLTAQALLQIICNSNKHICILLSLQREIVKDIKTWKVIKWSAPVAVKGVPFHKTINTVDTSTRNNIHFVISSNIPVCAWKKSAIAWLLFAVQIPLLIFRNLNLRQSWKPKQIFTFLSSMLKWIMVGGIGSVIAGQFYLFINNCDIRTRRGGWIQGRTVAWTTNRILPTSDSRLPTFSNLNSWL